MAGPAAYTPKKITSHVPDAGLGFLVTLECGHTVWCAIDPAGWKEFHCGACLDDLITHLRRTHEEVAQLPDGGEETLP